jgi:hypothetical protein
MGSSGSRHRPLGRAWKIIIPRLLAVAATVAIGLVVDVARLAAATPSSPTQLSSTVGNTSDSARQDAIRSVPLEKLSPDDRAKVKSVLANVSIFRRLPIRVVDCDPDLYLFLVRHPDVVINIWELMKVSQLQLRQIDDNLFRISEPGDTSGQFEFVYQNHDTHVLYGEGMYQGSLLPRPVKGRGVLVLKCGYVRETDGRYYITSRLDSFVTIEPLGAELIGKTISPLMGRTVDSNFTQTIAFVGSLSRSAELNSRSVQRLAGQLTHVQPDVRQQFAEVAADVSHKTAVAVAHDKTRLVEAASRSEDTIER